MFKSFMNLPTHMLVLHFTVVLIPLAALATCAVCVVGKLREKFLLYVAGVNVGLLVLTFVTVRAGYALQGKMDPTRRNVPNNDHAGWGDALLWVVLALALISALAAALSRLDVKNPAALAGLGLLVAALAVAAAGVTIVTGHTGSQSHWGYLYESK